MDECVFCSCDDCIGLALWYILDVLISVVGLDWTGLVLDWIGSGIWDWMGIGNG